ncbi:MAG TPA: hypothetical protein VK736_12290 [Candidatus Binatia bacterium]|nr:hypothetical protein [Candidatus Binatia bacterium]
MVRIRRFSVIRTSNVAAVIYFILTAIFVIPFILFTAATPMTVTDSLGRTVSFQLPWVFLLFVPFLYAGFGWLFTALGCLIYNLAARWTGGVEFEAIAVAPSPPPAPPAAPQPPPAASPPQ